MSKPAAREYPFEFFAWNDDVNDHTTWCDGDKVKKAYDRLAEENKILREAIELARPFVERTNSIVTGQKAAYLAIKQALKRVEGLE